jgi:DnaK suppressor protein
MAKHSTGKKKGGGSGKAKPRAKPAAKAKAPARKARPAGKAKPPAKSKPAAKAKPVPRKAAKPAPRAKPAAKPAPAPKGKPVAAKPAAAKPVPAKPGVGKPVAAKPGQVKAAEAAKAPAAKAPMAKPATRAAPKSSGVQLKSMVLAMPTAAPIARPTGPKAVAVIGSKVAVPSKAAKKPGGPLKVQGNEVVRIDLPAGYTPSTKDPYMSPKHLEYFRRKLLQWRVDLVEESKQTIDNLRDEVRDVGDEAERATRETENSLELRTRDRYRKLIGKIDKALRRIEDGEYGYCEETGEEIGLERLEARPIATLCLDAQERWEHRQRQLGD